jgi:hypothetical protein
MPKHDFTKYEDAPVRTLTFSQDAAPLPQKMGRPKSEQKMIPINTHLPEDLMREFKQVIEYMHRDNLKPPKFAEYARRAIAEFVAQHRPD